MELYYASDITQIKYNKCPKCNTSNTFESMHFIYHCTECSFYTCNFCMADYYNAGKAIHISKPIYKTTCTPSPTKTKRRKRKTTHRNKEKHNICIGSKLLMPDGAFDSDGNELGSYELHKVKRIDEEGFVITQYGEIDVTDNDDYYIVDTKCKGFKKGQLVASRWPQHEAKWAQYYVGSILSIDVEGGVARYNVLFH
eukprot:298116_1